MRFLSKPDGTVTVIAITIARMRLCMSTSSQPCLSDQFLGLNFVNLTLAPGPGI